MLRRLAPVQPDTFAFTPANLAWAAGQIAKYPAGRQASAVIPLLWRAQEQEGWLSRPAIEHIADMLGMPYIRALEVATFYFMFQLQPTGSIAHVQICGTTSCMICGAEALIEVCKKRIASAPFTLSADGKYTWEEVECLGACTNAPMVQIGKDYYEDLTPESFERILDDLAAGKRPAPGPQNGRYASEPLGGLTSLKEFESGRTQYNGTAQRAVDIGDGVKRIDGTEVPLLTPWIAKPAKVTPAEAAPVEPKPGKGIPADETGATVQEAPAVSTGSPDASAAAPQKPAALAAAREGGPDNLKAIKGVGPKLEALLHRLGFFHFDQIAAWTAAELAWVDDNLEGFKGRASRDGWVEQAKILAAGGETEFSARVTKGDVY